MMKEFIVEAPEVFGDIWDLYCDLRGVKKNHSREKSCTEGKQHEVFFELMAMICTANRKKLTHWALIQNAPNSARVVGQTAESAVAFFGHTLSAGTRTRIVNRITGNEKEAFHVLIFIYDNYQRELTCKNNKENTRVHLQGDQPMRPQSFPICQLHL